MATEKKIPPNFFWQETSLKVHLEAAQWGQSNFRIRILIFIPLQP